MFDFVGYVLMNFCPPPKKKVVLYWTFCQTKEARSKEDTQEIMSLRNIHYFDFNIYSY